MINLKSIFFITIVVSIYIFSFLGFIKDLDKENINFTKSDTIVVLTGNTGRLKAAVDLMVSNTDARLLISGVAKGVKYSEIIKNNDIDRGRINLGYKAKSTLGNAIETKTWIQKNNFKDLTMDDFIENFHNLLEKY